MFRRTHCVTLAALLSLASARAVPAQQSDTVSLPTTVAWIRDFYGSRGGVYSMVGSAIYTIDQISVSVVSPCEIEVQSRLSLGNEAPSHMYHRVNFALLAPRAKLIEITSGSVVVSLETTTGQKLLAGKTVKNGSTESVMSSAAGFHFTDVATAQRFGKALEHAARLCGGKPSPF